MREGRGSHCPLHMTPEPDWWLPRFEGSNSKANTYTTLRQCGAHRYPSPPMSNPPSPPRAFQEHTASLSRVPRISDAVATSTATASPMPIAAALGPSYSPPLYDARDSAHFRHTSEVTTSSQSLQAPSTHSPAQARLSLDSHATYLPRTNEPRTEPSAGQKTGRKSKAHVASACIHCKRAHLSCDINRPCTRCVSSGKQDSCFDVQHKKRGRPRLREEGSFTLERAGIEPALATALSINESAVERPIALPRPQLTECFRALRSQPRDTSTTPASPSNPHPPLPTANAASLGHRYIDQPTEYEIPAAFLDLDLVILKANQSFCQVMSLDARRHAGTPLDTVVSVVDGESFQTIRADLRIERERRDPAYMPPIVQSGQDVLGGAKLEDTDRYAQGSDIRSGTWTRSQAGLPKDRFPARMTLAKSQAWFVALTLPSFRPTPPLAYPPPGASPFPAQTYPSTEQAASSQHVAPYSAPATAWAPLTYDATLPAPLQTPDHYPTRSCLPPEPPLGYQGQAQHPTSAQRSLQNVTSFGTQPSATNSKLNTALSLPSPAAFTPQSAPRELLPSHDSIAPTSIQLPRITGHAAAPAASTSGAHAQAALESSIQAGVATSFDSSLDDDNVDASRLPRKRRKLDLDDVLRKD